MAFTFDPLLSLQQNLLSTKVWSGTTNIGYITDTDKPCNAQIHIFSEYAPGVRNGTYPPSSWTIPDFFGQQSLGTWCAKQGLVPSWATVTSGKVSIPSTNAAKGTAPVIYNQTPQGTLAPAIRASGPLSLPDLVLSSLPDLSETGKNVAGALGMGTLMLGGGALFLLLLSRR